MEFIAHRINTVNELRDIPNEYGVEIDLRDYGSDLILHHDPFTHGESFEDFLKCYDHGTLILNIKSERIEAKVKELIEKYSISQYFYLDSSFPMIHLLSSNGESKISLRYSEYEGMDTLRNMKGKVEWIWVDCFNTLPIDATIFEEIKALEYKLCLVSPELQGRDEEIELFAEKINLENIKFDAICTKFHNIDRWKKALNILNKRSITK